jgi:Phage integrase family
LITAQTFRRTFITLMLEAGAPVPYVQGQVGHEDPTTTLEIYAQVLKRRDRRRHGEAFDALMADAVPSAASIMMRTDSDRSEDLDALDLPTVSEGSGPRKQAKAEFVARGDRLSNDHRHKHLAICGAFAEPSWGLEPQTPSLPWKCSTS